MDRSTEQLARIYQAGFHIEQLERFPHAIGVVRDGCIALLQSTPTGLAIIGSCGRRMGEIMGVLVEKHGRKVFQAKELFEEATPDRLQQLKNFERDLKVLLTAE